MNLQRLYLSFDGRISRHDFWRAGLWLLLAEAGLAFFLSRAAHLTWADYAHGGPRAGLVNLVTVSFFFWPSLALTTKRLHDRDTSGWWAGVLHLLLFMTSANLAFARPLLVGRDVFATFLWAWPGLLLAVLGAWLVFELVAMPGGSGPNRFGADPDAHVPPAPAGVAAMPAAGHGLSREPQPVPSAAYPDRPKSVTPAAKISR